MKHFKDADYIILTCDIITFVHIIAGVTHDLSLKVNSPNDGTSKVKSNTIIMAALFCVSVAFSESPLHAYFIN